MLIPYFISIYFVIRLQTLYREKQNIGNKRGLIQVLRGTHISLSTKIHEENHHNRGQDDCGTPGVLSPTSRHAYTCRRSDLAVGRVQQMNEGCCDNHPCAEVTCKEIHVEGHAHSRHSFCDNGEQRRQKRTDADHKLENGQNLSEQTQSRK